MLARRFAGRITSDMPPPFRLAWRGRWRVWFLRGLVAFARRTSTSLRPVRAVYDACMVGISLLALYSSVVYTTLSLLYILLSSACIFWLMWIVRCWVDGGSGVRDEQRVAAFAAAASSVPLLTPTALPYVFRRIQRRAISAFLPGAAYAAKNSGACASRTFTPGDAFDLPLHACLPRLCRLLAAASSYCRARAPAHATRRALAAAHARRAAALLAAHTRMRVTMLRGVA